MSYDPKDEVPSTVIPNEKIEIIENLNFKSTEYLDLRNKLVRLNKELYEKAIADKSLSVSEITKITKSLQSFLEFDSADKVAMLARIASLPENTKKLIKKVTGADQVLDSLSTKDKISKTATDIFG